MYFVYILKSNQKRKHPFYIGVSSDLIRRLREHNSPFNSGYTRGYTWRIIYVEGYPSKDIAYNREKMLKQYGNVWYGVRRRIFGL
jgi:predicted GIY-YIG superfamily endonuclease